jgi:hypothetical protein
MYTELFWKDAFERAVKTVAQSLITLWLVGNEVFNILTVNWQQAFGVAAGAGLISLLMSIVSAKVGDNQSASLVVDTKAAK